MPADPDLILPLLAYLNSEIVTEYLSLVTPQFQGGFRKFEPQHLSNIPIPNAVLAHRERLAYNAKRVLAAVHENSEDARRSAERAIEQIIEAAIALSDREM